MRVLRARGVLFDLDGTLVSSIAAVDRAWRRWAVEYDMDPDYVAARIHGRRARDSIAALAPDVDQEIAFELIEHLEATDVTGVVPAEGAHELLAKLEGLPWGIVTSGTQAIALPRLKAARIPVPEVFVTAEQITRGKPHPDAFLMGAARLGLRPEAIVAFEDTLAGVQSAASAGMRVVAMTEEAAAEAEVAISSFLDIRVELEGGELSLEFKPGSTDSPSVV